MGNNKAKRVPCTHADVKTLSGNPDDVSLTNLIGSVAHFKPQNWTAVRARSRKALKINSLELNFEADKCR